MIVDQLGMSVHMNKVGSTHSPEHESRDPQEINKSVELIWPSIVGEPDNVRSADWAWRTSTLIFNIVFGWTYKILTGIFAPIAAVIIGFSFAVFIFLQIWCFRPVLKFLHLIFALVRTLGEIVYFSILGPIFETLGLCLSNVKVRHQRVYDAKDEPQFPFII